MKHLFVITSLFLLAAQTGAHAAPLRASWFEALLRRLPGVRATATETELNRAARAAEAEVQEYRIVKGRSPERPPGADLPADEALVASDAIERAFHLVSVDPANFAARGARVALGQAAIEELAIPAGKAMIRGMRYVGEGQPILLAHGFLENSRIWRTVAQKLQGMGHDVWIVNWRGHGRGGHRSVVRDYAKGDYGFRAMVEGDVPAVLERIHRVTGKKAVVVGHSMGGLLLRAAPAQLVLRRIEIGAPVDFEEVSRLVRGLELLSRIVFRGRDFVLKLNRDPLDFARASVEERLARGLLKSLLRDVADPLLVKAFPKQVVNTDNLTLAEFTTLRQNVSDLHADLAREMGAMVRGRDATLGGMAPTHDPTIPSLIVVGGVDGVVPAHRVLDAVDDAVGANPGALIWSARIGRAGHEDLIVGQKAANDLAPLIDRFARDPELLGPPGSHLEIF